MSIFLNYLSMWTIIVLVAFVDFSLACTNKSRNVPSCATYSVDPQIIHLCPERDCNEEYCKKYICNSSSLANSPFKTSVDHELGKLTVSYDLRRQPEYHDIDINLYACENITDSQECSKIDPVRETRRWENCNLHSTKYLSLLWDNSSGTENHTNAESCSKEITVTFDLVYTACYYFTIQRCGSSSSTDVYSCPEVVETKYHKELLIDKSIQYADTCNPSSNGRYISLVIHEYFQDLPASTFIINKKMEHNSVKNLIICHNAANELKLDCMQYNDPVQDWCTMSVQKFENGTKLFKRLCNLFNLTDGDYSYSLWYDDLRCRIETVWTDEKYVPNAYLYRNCEWERDITCTYPTDAIDKNEKDFTVTTPSSFLKMLLYVVGSLIVIAILSLLVAMILYQKNKIERRSCERGYCHLWRKSTPDSSSSETNIFQEEELMGISTDSSINKSEKTKLILIYARDCDEFQEVMNRFRNILIRFGFEVYDYWDDNQARNLTHYGFEQWVDMKMNESHNLAVLVTSDCAVELERRYLCGLSSDQYCNPTNMDNLFRYALNKIKSVIASESQEQSQKIFIVSIKDKLDGLKPQESLGLPINSSYHCIPTQLKILLNDLKRIDRLNEIEGLSESKDYAEFVKAVETFIDFKVKYPQYISEILIPL